MGVALIPERGPKDGLQFPWSVWAPIWIYTRLVAGDVLDDGDYQGGGTNDGYLISAEKAAQLGKILNDRLARGLKDDAAVREAFRIDEMQHRRIQAVFEEFDKTQDRAHAEGREATSEEMAAAVETVQSGGKLSPLPLDDSEHAARVFRGFEGVVREFATFCAACGKTGGFRVG